MRYDRITGQLEDLKQQIRDRWSKVTDADVQSLNGDLGRLVGVVAKRYAIPAKKARADVAEFTEQVGTSFKEAAQVMGDAALDLWRNGRERVAEVVNNGSDKAADLWSAGKQQVDDFRAQTDAAIQARPLTSVAIAAGVGALLALLLRRRSA
ncbi:MAG: hypothetical protein R3F56_11995 [Planctomycetota bacterium]